LRKHARHVTNDAIWSAVVGVITRTKKRKPPKAHNDSTITTGVVAENSDTSRHGLSVKMPLLTGGSTTNQKPSATTPIHHPIETSLERFKRTSENIPCAIVFHWHQDVLGDTHFSFDVLNARRLDRYLETQHKRSDSIETLQQFVQPKGEYDHFIRVLWTYKVCLMDKYVNRYKWKDPSVDITKRISILSENLVIGSEITHEERLSCHKLADMLVAHLNKRTKKLHHISHLAFTCKQDKHGLMHFLWFDEFRTTTEPISGLVPNEKQDFKLANISYSLCGDFVHGWPSVSLQTAAVANATQKKRRKQRTARNSRSPIESLTQSQPNGDSPSTSRRQNAHRLIPNGGSGSANSLPSHFLLNYIPSNTLPYMRDPHSNSIVHSNILLYHQQLYNLSGSKREPLTLVGTSATENASTMFDSRLTLSQQSDPVCSICEKRYDISLQHHLEYDSILKYYDQKNERNALYANSFLNNPGDAGKSARTLTLQTIVPPEIFRNEPSMSIEDFREARTSSAFLNRTLEVCEQCHQQYLKAIMSAFTLPSILRSKVFERTAHHNEQMKTYSVTMRHANESLGEYQRRVLKEKRRHRSMRRSPYDVLV